jgi:predicted RNase H-like HicB family nuclease
MPAYAVKLTRRYDGLFIASFPDVPEALAYGRDNEEALEEAAKSLEAAFRRRILSGDDLPEPRANGPLLIHQEVLAAALA